MNDNEIELARELDELYKVIAFPCSEIEEQAARERIIELETLLNAKKRTSA